MESGSGSRLASTLRKVEKDDDEGGKNKVHPRAMHEGVNEWVSYGTQRTWRQVRRSGVERQAPCVIMRYNGRV